MTEFQKSVNWKIVYDSGDIVLNNEFCDKFIKSWTDFEMVSNNKTGEVWCSSFDGGYELGTLDIILRLRDFMKDNPQFKKSMKSLKIISNMNIIEESDCTIIFKNNYE